MKLLDILKPECVKVPLASEHKTEAIGELVDIIGKFYGCQDVTAIRQAVIEREQTRTTGIGQGLAIPHCKSRFCSELQIAIGKPQHPINFGSIDGKPVELIVLLASPPNSTSEHIQALAGISRLMTIDACREAAYKSQTAEELYQILKEYESH